jgi:hypothetical protein
MEATPFSIEKAPYIRLVRKAMMGFLFFSYHNHFRVQMQGMRGKTTGYKLWVHNTY